MVGRSDDELVGQYAKDLFPPEDVPFLLSQIGLGTNSMARLDSNSICRNSMVDACR